MGGKKKKGGGEKKKGKRGSEGKRTTINTKGSIFFLAEEGITHCHMPPSKGTDGGKGK